MNERDRLLRFYDESVLLKYRESPKLFKVEEEADPPGGSVCNSTDAAWYAVDFGYRQLKDGNKCIGTTRHAICKLPESEQSYWSLHELQNLEFAENDPEFDRWAGTHLRGEW